VLTTQTDKLALQRKIASDMRDIWAMQPRFERRTGKSPYKLLEHPRLRAGYDFLLLRCASGEIDAELGQWWTDFMDGDGAQREELLTRKPRGASDEAGPKKRARKRGPRKAREDGATGDGGARAAGGGSHGDDDGGHGGGGYGGGNLA
jgi:poly(A) polymerase